VALSSSGDHRGHRRGLFTGKPLHVRTDVEEDEEAEYELADGTRIHAWWLPQKDSDTALLYCHGNGDCVGYLGQFLHELHERQRVTVFAFDYRGYGKSEGDPAESGILADGHAAQLWLAERTKRKPADIVLMGRSIGGAVATAMAAEQGAKFVNENDAICHRTGRGDVKWEAVCGQPQEILTPILFIVADH
jgi:fermentation-respiration switch protein FrsA (DUF1100 family)